MQKYLKTLHEERKKIGLCPDNSEMTTLKKYSPAKISDNFTTRPAKLSDNFTTTPAKISDNLKIYCIFAAEK